MKKIPFEEPGFGWVVPVVTGLVIGLLIRYI